MFCQFQGSIHLDLTLLKSPTVSSRLEEHSDKPEGSDHKAAADHLPTFDYWTMQISQRGRLKEAQS